MSNIELNTEDKIHFPMNMGGVTFSVEMRSGDGAPIGPILCIKSQQNGHTLNLIEILTSGSSLQELSMFLKERGDEACAMEKNDELITFPLASCIEPRYKGDD